jgi:phosphatidylglycerophosphate synthase
MQKRWIPWSMVAFRAGLGPVVLVGERCRWNGVALAGMVLAALLSDIFDGVLARRWKTDTAALRLADSLADTGFYLCVGAAIGFGMPAVWRDCRGGVLFLVACEGLRFGFDFFKFGKPASYHSYLAKLWGLVLATAVIVTFETQRISLWMGAAIVLGILSNAETLAMSLILPVWRRDVKTLATAWRMRVILLHGRAVPRG